MHATSDIELPPPAGWVKVVLRLAAIYNLAWGVWVVFWPAASLAACGYPDGGASQVLWQCIGMIVGVYGVGYWISAGDPFRHWPIVLVGLLGKVFGPVGFVWAWLAGRLPGSAGRVLLLNDLIWWAPFAVILWQAVRNEQSRSAQANASPPLEDALRSIPGSEGQSLAQLSAGQAVLVVFLRHAGCTFCREALADLAQRRSEIESRGTKLALVHMGDDASAARLFESYGLGDVPRFSDPEQQLYRAFGLGLGGFRQLFGWKVIRRGASAALLARHGFGPIQGNGFRMPGVFLLRDGKILAAYRHQTAADRPDYAALACSAGASA